MKKYFLLISAIICAVFLVAPAAKADLMGPYVGIGVNDDASVISGLLGYTVALLDKQGYDDGEATGELEGVLAGLMEITILEDNKYATISWDLTGLGYAAYAVAVKDGNANHSGIQWVYYTVTEAQRIIGGGNVDTLANGAGAISHISLYGAETAIPEPATMLLLGSGLIGLAGFARKRFKK